FQPLCPNSLEFSPKVPLPCFLMPLFCRITKPLTFADCVGDELPLGWEIVYDPQVGVYYIDHINQITQIEDPRAQWRREQERMLKEYLVVAQEALNAKKEIYQVKQLRLELAQEEYQQLHDMCEDDRVSYVSSYSSSSSNTKYDPDQIKAEIAGRREALSRLKRELAQMKQELQYKEKGVETLQEIDRKMSNSQTNYKLGEAQEIMNELRTIKKSITSGEQERQDLIQSLARLTDEFRNSCYIGNSLQDLRTNAGLAVDCLSQQYSEASSQTDIIGEVCFEIVSSIQLQLAQLDNETWPGSAEADRDRLQLIKEKQALLQELQLISQQKRSPEELTRLEAEQKRLEDDIQLAQSIPHQELTERMLLQEKKNCLLKQLEEATRLTTYLNSQLKSLTASSLTVSSGSSRGSLASSCGSLASSRGSLSSVSFTDIYGLPQYETDNSTDLGSHLQFDFLPFDTVTKDHSYTEHCGLSNLNKPRRSFDPPQSLASLSSRSSLSSLSPPSSPLDTPYHSASRDSPLAQMNEEFEELVGRSESENLRLQAQAVCQDLQEAVSSQVTGASFGDMKFSQDIAPRLRPAVQGLGVTMRSDSAIKASRRTRRVSAGLSDDSVATDSGVFEALNKRYIRISLLPFDSNTAFTFCSKPLEFQALITYSESFPILVPASVLRLKSLQLDICSIDQQIQEDLLVKPFPEEIGIRPKERSSRRSRGSPFVRSSTIVRSQTFSPGARSQYVCRLYRSDSDSSTLPKRSPFIRNTLERRTLRYKQPSFKTPLVEHSTRTSLDLELDLQASRTRQRQLNEELNALRELKQRMEESRLRGQSDLPQWILRDERFKNLLKEAERQAKQTKSEQRQEQAAEKMLKKATKEVYQLRGNSQKEPLQVQSFREKMAFFTRTRINIPPLPADDV
uniref:WWC family member 3 n=1 Tax=Callorhinchus milii TaxID=7868 RepID=A0A4W3IAY5_CALMI